MLINYDPDGKPEITREMTQLATALRMHIVHVICDEPPGEEGEEGEEGWAGVSFAAVMPFLPCVGHEIRLEDGKTCRVERVIYRVFTRDGCVCANPNVYAVLLSPLEAE
jgi:hypothetical protein